jgi:hypothetical protein
MNPEDFTTPERREMARTLSASVPQTRVLERLESSLKSNHIEVVLTATEQLSRVPELLQDSLGAKAVVRSLLPILKGSLNEVAASREQRGRALDVVIALGHNGAAAVPVLAELLTADDPNLDSVFGQARPFTRGHIINALEKMGSAASEHLPTLEAIVPQMQKREREDALLSPQQPQTFQPLSARLRWVIDYKIKERSKNSGFD